MKAEEEKLKCDREAQLLTKGEGGLAWSIKVLCVRPGDCPSWPSSQA